MAKKIKNATYIIIAFIILSAVTAITIVKGQEVKPVMSVAMASNSNNSILVKWDKVKKADGYILFNCDEVSKKSQQLARVNGEDSCQYEFENLPGATVYNLEVKAFKHFLNKEYLSKQASNVIIYSIPDVVNLSAFSGGRGVLSVEWEPERGLNGYEIQYASDSSFSDAVTRVVKDRQTRNISINELTPGKKYFVRGRSYMLIDGKKIYGKWGESAFAVINDRNLDIENINPNKPMVALSFDDGPAFTYKGENTTERILDVLEKYNARATFFMVGERVDKSTQYLLERELKIGCELGNHTYGHTHYGEDVTALDISKASERIKKYAGQYPTIFRCPGGKLTSVIKKECKKEGMPLAYWSVDTDDWKSKNSKLVYKKVINQVYDGSIILMHDIYPSTADAVELIVPKLIKKGYQIVTVSQLITAKTGQRPKAGQQYVDCETINNHTK